MTSTWSGKFFIYETLTNVKEWILVVFSLNSQAMLESCSRSMYRQDECLHTGLHFAEPYTPFIQTFLLELVRLI